MQTQINSANITKFQVEVIFDIFNRKVTFNDLSIYAGSSGSGIFNVLGISFLLKDQQGIDLATIDFSDPTKYIVPSVTRTFEVDLSSIGFQFLFQSYKIQAAIKDADGTIYYVDPVYKKICEPAGIVQAGYVPGIYQVSANCVDNALTVKDQTPYVYDGNLPQLITKTGNLYYPTGTISPVSFTGTPFQNNTIYDGQYRVVATSVAEYDLGDDVYVYVTYKVSNAFDVTCANKIADLVCCLLDLQHRYQKNCDNAIGKEAKRQLDEITIPFLLGLAKEISGQDASSEAELIKKKLRCDCGASSIRHNEFTPINPAVTNIVFTGGGATSVPTPSVDGNTKTYTITSPTYALTKSNMSDLGFSIEQQISGNNVQYKVSLNYSAISQSVLQAISADPSMVQVFNSLVSATSNYDISGLDGKCVIDLTQKNYFLTQAVVPASTKVVRIYTSTTNFAAPANTYASDAASVQAWLNGLGIGTFVVTYNAGTFSVLSLNNVNSITSLEFSSPALTVPFQSTNATLISVIQAIVDYLCALSDSGVKLANTITLWQIDYNGNPVSFSNFANQGVLNQAIADSIYNIVGVIRNLTGVTCTKIAAIFQEYPENEFGESDRVYGSLGGNCAAMSDKQVAKLVIAAIGKYSDVKALFCAIDCDTTGTCPEIAGISLSMVGNNIGVYGVAFVSTPSAAQTVTVMYKKSNQVNFSTATSALVLLPNGSINGTSPFQIAGLEQGQQYDVKIVNNCGGKGFVQQITVPTGAAYSRSLLKDNILYMLCGGAPTTYYTGAPFGVGQVIYTDAGLTTPLTGFAYVADNTSGQIYTVNPANGLVTADTGTNCQTGVGTPGFATNDLGGICSSPIDTLYYTNGAFGVGKVIYTDSSLTTPLSGYSYFLNMDNNRIYTVNSVTGVVTGDTGQTCASYGGSYVIGNDYGAACGAGFGTYYTNGPFGVGIVVFTDSLLTTPLTGYSFIGRDEGGVINIYNINSVTGLVTSQYDLCPAP